MNRSAQNVVAFCEYHQNYRELPMRSPLEVRPVSLPPARPSDASPFARKGHLQRAAEWADLVGLTRALQPLHDHHNPALTVLAYHRVMPIDALAEYPLDPELISATPKQFESQMAYLRTHRQPVSLDAVVAHIEGKHRLPESAVAVTFDDGFLDTYRYAFPILKRYRIPATIFVATGYIDSGEPFWFELAAYLIYNLEPLSLELYPEGLRFPAGSSFAERTRGLRQLQGILKNMPNDRRISLISEWRTRFADRIAHGAMGFGGPMSWSQIREMADAGIEFGSHSVTHPNLTQLNDRDLEWELRESKRTLEDHLQSSVRTLAYPIGNRDSFDDRVIAATRNAGFQLGVTYVAGANSLPHVQQFGIHRHGVGLGTTDRFFRAMTRLPSWIH